MSKVTSQIEYGNNVTDLDEWQQSSNPWTVTLRYQRRQMTVNFWTGSALGEPSTADVLECLFSDASGYDNARDFEDWAAEYGYDSDSRKAERIYKAVEKQTRKLRNLLGDDYEKLVYADYEDIGKYAA